MVMPKNGIRKSHSYGLSLLCLGELLIISLLLWMGRFGKVLTLVFCDPLSFAFFK